MIWREDSMFLALIYFLVVGVGLGFAAWKLLKVEEEDSVARLFLYLATGIVIFVQASTILGFLHLSNWVVYLVLTALLLAVVFRNGIPHVKIPQIKGDWVLVLLMFIAHLYVYTAGAFSYPWLEDDDPWVHASAVRYVSLFSTYLQPDHLPIKYLAPYPPFFDVLLGVLFQVSDSLLQDHLKFFNALLVSLAIPFFYLWAKEKLGRKTALWSTLVITVLPSFMSHFIWAQTLSMLLVFPALYFIERVVKSEGKERFGFGVLAVLTSASVFITQPSSAAMFFGLLAVYVAAVVLSGFLKGKLETDKVKPIVAVFLAAFILALLEFWIPMFVLFPAEEVFGQMSLSIGILTESSIDTSGGITYGINDFINAPLSSKMDQPTGFGLAVFLLLLFGLLSVVSGFREKKWDAAVLLALAWLAYGIVGTEGNMLPVKLVPHRFWVFLAIPVAMLAGIGALKVLEYVEKTKKELLTISILVLVAALIMTSAYPKFVVETSSWPPGVSWASMEHVSGYVKLKEGLPADTKVFNFCMPENFANGMDKFGYSWEKEVEDYKFISVTDNLNSNYQFLEKYEYEYVVLDQYCLHELQPEEIQGKLDSLAADDRFVLQSQLSSNAFFVFKIS